MPPALKWTQAALSWGRKCFIIMKPAATDAAHLIADLAMRAFSLAIPRVFSEGENRTGELTAREEHEKARR